MKKKERKMRREDAKIMFKVPREVGRGGGKREKQSQKRP
jgi:hypothetical protein